MSLCFSVKSSTHEFGLTMYAYAKLSSIDFGILRIFGAGLGNLLFPWGRCIVAAKKHGMIPVWPTWAQVKLGPLLRMEQDKRFYHNLFAPPDGYVSGLHKLDVLLGTPRVAEQDLDELREGASQRVLVVYEGMEHYFREILRDHALVRTELLRMTRPNHRNALAVNFYRTISVHVRLGDFSVAPINAAAVTTGHVNFRIPLSWYVEVVNEIRRGVGEDWPILVFSDGTDRELEQLLRLPRCSRAGFGSSLADMLALSRAHVLVASGSTFSMWASYLGRMPVVWHSTQHRQRLYYDEVDKEEVVVEGARLSAKFILTLAHDAEGKCRT